MKPKLYCEANQDIYLLNIYGEMSQEASIKGYNHTNLNLIINVYHYQLHKI